MREFQPTITKALPVNLITGFLGVGKTTAIRHLLAHKPENEHWAVLVNEMGEVGIDGALLEQDGIAVKQVAGGCMCCVTGLPSKVALNALIREQRPDRILIEPSGIANPRQILDTYTSAEYRGVLDLRATLCLVDPWMLTQPAFLALETFQDQLELADILLATKADKATADEIALFEALSQQLPEKRVVATIAHGKIDPAWLDLPPLLETHTAAPSRLPLSHHLVADSDNTPDLPTLSAGDTELIRLENQSDEAWGCGWLIPPGWEFRETPLWTLLVNLEIPRIKGILPTDSGWFAVNRMRDHCEWRSTTAPEDGIGKLEMIALSSQEWKKIEDTLRDVAVVGNQRD